MNDPNEMPPSSTAITPLAPPPPAGPRGRVVLAWLAILALGGVLIYWQNFGKKGTAVGAQNEAAQLVMLELQMRLFVGIPEFTKANQKPDPVADKAARESLMKSVETLNRGSVTQRLCALITIGELAGAEQAKSGLVDLKAEIEKANHEPSPREAKDLDVLIRLYTDYADGRPDAPTVSPEDREDLVKSLGWFGELALAPARADEPPNAKRTQVLAEANQTLVGVIGVVIVFIVALLLGIFGLFILGVLAFNGAWKPRFGGPVAHHGVYVETFALWFGVYFGLIFVTPLVLRGRVSDVVVMSLPMLLSLLVLAWPVIRGVAWKQVRQDIGLSFGKQPLVEPLMGFIAYANSLPFLIVGVVVTLTLIRYIPRQAGPAGDPFQSDPTMAHPLMQQLRNASVDDILPYFFLMCVLAPIMEEIMFRGCLYRHLRDATRTWFLGGIFSALVVSVIFAAVHPQGVFAIPLLASLACGFTLAREWRGTLIPSMIAHGLNNSLILAFTIVCLMKW